MQVTIRKALSTDVPGIMALVRELALFEKAPEAVINHEAQMLKDGFGAVPAFECSVAESDGRIIGIALYYMKYSTWKGKGYYLDDIVVTERYRNQGIGKNLFDAFVEAARNAGARYLHWQVLDWNEGAIRFYERIGSSFDAEWIDCKMTEEQINNYR